MPTDAFDEVDWPNVYCTLNEEVPRLFQIWACKQVMNISTTNKNLCLHHQNGHSDKCPCCTIYVETVEHVILCLEVFNVEACMQSSWALKQWLEEANTDPDMIDYIADYIQGRNTIPMASAVQNTLAQFHALGQLQDIIGWWRFLERIFFKK